MRFKPSILLTFVLLILALGFLRLGYWQQQRQLEKRELFEAFAVAPEMSVDRALDEDSLFARVVAKGHFDSERHLLLDNRIHESRAGVHVFSPFTTSTGRVLLVNRGWLPLAPDRRELPEIAAVEGPVTIRGILNRPPRVGHQVGDDDVLVSDQWPQLVTYLDVAAASQALQLPLQNWVIQLDSNDSAGFAGRDWQPAVMGPETHGAYAIQWYALALTAFVIWIVLGIRRAS